jgi:hypothetical protein
MVRDPERFGRNVLQFSNPRLFETRLLDILDAVPMHVRLDHALDSTPTLNVLNSALTKAGMTGGPNTIINLAFRIAQLGVPVRLVTTVETSTMDTQWFLKHVSELLGTEMLAQVPIVSAADPKNPLSIGLNDVFLASHWTTAQQLKSVLPKMKNERFFYILQEFEPGFYSWSSNYALAVETYGMDFYPIINEKLLARHMFASGLGRLGEKSIQDSAIIFEPAVDGRIFKPNSDQTISANRPRRLLFYARPTNARNMFGLGIAALREATKSKELEAWDILAIGGRGSVPQMALNNGLVLKAAPWMNYDGYAGMLREADVLLCPMLSPHTSYPVLEMPATGGLSVTNTFSFKTREELETLSDGIVATEPTVEGLSAGIVDAVYRVNRGRIRNSSLNMARDWGSTLTPAAAQIAELFASITTS